MQGGTIKDKALEKIGQKLIDKGFNLTSLSNDELAEVAVKFTGDAPPAHIPRETVIEILSQQDSVKKWAQSVRQNMAPKAQKVVTENIRSNVQNIQSSVSSKIESDPMAAKMADKFGEWLKDSGYTTAQLTQMLDANSDMYISNDEAMKFVRQISNSEPPQWVIDSLMKIMDANTDGKLSVEEWWGFLESIGFEKPLENTTESESVADEFLDLEEEFQETTKSIDELKVDQEEAARIMEEANKEALLRMKKQEEELKSAMATETTLDSISKSTEVVEQKIEKTARETASAITTASAGAAVIASQVEEQAIAVRVPVTDGSISWEIENPNEIMIERLEQSRLSSEAEAIIVECHEHLCA
ncbi:MAG: EF-hand domain-containing protein, partial [Candidatus Poseidoniaceae archaeon]|nr:EF-hand domain-containing protein [Candidatus Poseidoniaceae archaeon]